MIGDLSYAHPWGQSSVDQHFNDVMAWSQRRGVHAGLGKPRVGERRPRTTSATTRAGSSCPTRTRRRRACGRLLRRGLALVRRGRRAVHLLSGAVLEQRRGRTGRSQIDAVFAAAQADPSINFIVTFGHRPAYSTGFHDGEADAGGRAQHVRRPLLEVRAQPQRALTRLRAVPCRSTASPTSRSPAAEPASRRRGPATDSRTAFRAMHLEHLRVDVSVDRACASRPCAGRRRRRDDIACVQGSVIDSYTIGANPPPPPPPPPTLYVAKGNASCSDGGSGTAAQPFCTIKPAASRVVAGPDRARLLGHLQRDASPCRAPEPRPRRSTSSPRPGATATVTGATTATPTASTCPAGATSPSRVQRHRDERRRDRRQELVEHHDPRESRELGRASPCSGKTAKGIRLDELDRLDRRDNIVDHNTDYGIYLVGSDAASGRARQPSLRQRPGFRARGLGDPALQLDRQHRLVKRVARQRGLRDRVRTRARTTTSSSTTSTYDNGDHGIDNYWPRTGQRIIANTVYKNVTAGINVEGSSTGATIANNIASTTASPAPARAATSVSTPRRRQARPWTTTWST